ncbi:hypothetical protein [Prosthecobacter sp.]|uniref:hypothetical protein n=1 Tax=Prosthecobacter sp. TaxID=1965333 RepID=UPI003784088F
MIGCYDFCGHYEWTFEWLRQLGGHELVKAYWDEAINQDAQIHASTLITAKGFEGMKEYWGPTLADEGAVYHRTVTDTAFRIDMHECPSKGFLLRNGLDQYADYCDHCMGWIGPMMKQAGFVIDHQHNHCGQCWWEMRREEDATPPSAPGELSGAEDVRLRPGWVRDAPMDTYQRATEPDDKTTA